MRRVLAVITAACICASASVSYAKWEQYGANYNNWSFTKGDGLCRAVYNWKGQDYVYGIDSKGAEYVSLPNTAVGKKNGLTGMLEFEGKFPPAAVKAESDGARLWLKDFTGAEWAKFRGYGGYSYNVNGIKGKHIFADINPAMDRLTKCYNEIKAPAPAPAPANTTYAAPIGAWTFTHSIDNGKWLCRAVYKFNNKDWIIGRKVGDISYISIPTTIPKGKSDGSAIMTQEYALGGSAESNGERTWMKMDFDINFINSMVKYGGYDWSWESDKVKGNPRFKDMKPAMDTLNKCYREHGGKN